MNFPKDLISITDLNREQINEVLNLAKELKVDRYNDQKPLKGKTLGLFTTKPSLRTRLSFETGIFELGGNSLFIRNDEIGLGSRESFADIGRVLSRYLSAFIVRSHDHLGLIELAKFASIPIINALTDQEHPCQILADLLTLKENFGELKKLKLTYIGDGNNVCASLMLASAILGLEFMAITPASYEPSKNIVNQACHLAKLYESSAPIITNEPSEATKADVLYTENWLSMGQESSKEKIVKDFQNYQINSKLLNSQKIPVLHCLPAHKGEEISEETFEENSKLIFEQAENRLHAQKALLVKLIGYTNS